MAARTESRKFGAYLLDSTNGVVLKSWRPRQLRRARFTPRLRGGGSLITQDRLEGMQVSIAGDIVGADTGAVRDNLDALIDALSQGDQYLQFYDDRRLLCRLDGPVRFDFDSMGRSYAWQAKFTSRFPTWEDPTPVNEQFTPTGAGPHTMTTAAAIAGTSPAFPVITIQTHIALTGANLLLTNTGTLEQLNLVGLNLTDEQAILIDMREGFIGDGSSSSTLPFAIEGDWFSLSDGSTAVLEFAHNVGASSDWTIDVDYTPQYWVG